MGKKRQSQVGKRVFSRYFFVFVLSLSLSPADPTISEPGTGYLLGCSSKTAEPLFTAIKFVLRM